MVVLHEIASILYANIVEPSCPGREMDICHWTEFVCGFEGRVVELASIFDSQMMERVCFEYNDCIMYALSSKCGEELSDGMYGAFIMWEIGRGY